jgi:hypothetical protein
MHVFGLDRDDDGKPCPVCQLVLHQQALQAVAPVSAPQAAAWFQVPGALQPAFLVSVTPLYRDPRGPPAPLEA